MAKGKVDKNANIQGYFFMSINNGDLDVNMGGDKEMLSAAFATLLVDRDKEGKDIQQILAVAAAIAANELQKEKYSSKKKPNPKQMDGVESTEPFVKARKKKAK
jgi:hypothetical protein